MTESSQGCPGLGARRGLGSDLIEGGPDDNTLDARDGGADYVAGGAGFDRTLIDGKYDTLTGVE